MGNDIYTGGQWADLSEMSFLLSDNTRLKIDGSNANDLNAHDFIQPCSRWPMCIQDGKWVLPNLSEEAYIPFSLAQERKLGEYTRAFLQEFDTDGDFYGVQRQSVYASSAGTGMLWMTEYAGSDGEATFTVRSRTDIGSLNCV